MLIDGLSLRFHGLFLFLSGEVPPITKRRSDDDARVSRDAYDTKIDRFWVESAQKKPTGESGVKNHARGGLPRTKRPTFRPKTKRQRGRSQQFRGGPRRSFPTTTKGKRLRRVRGAPGRRVPTGASGGSPEPISARKRSIFPAEHS